MARKFIRQPDGKLAVFSTIIDDFIATSLTPSRAARWAYTELEIPLKEAKGLVEVATAEGDTLKRWREACAVIEWRHGMKHLERELTEMGQPVPEFSRIERAGGE